MNYYPVIIPTLNRYTHFKRCVESLARNTHASKTELIIGLDYPPSEKYKDGYLKIKDYLPSIKGFGRVTVFERLSNLGPTKNMQALTDSTFERYDAFIFTEDDNEFSPCFLDYMNKMLNHYKDDQRVYNVSGYLPLDFFGISTTGLLFTKEYNAWGSGTWKHKNPSFEDRRLLVHNILSSIRLSWKSFTTYPAAFRMMLKMVRLDAMWGDVTKTQINLFNGTFQVRPAISLVRNWGNDGSGIHCRNDDSIAQQPISEALTFEEPSDWEPYYSKDIAKATFRLSWPKNNFLFAGKLLITVFLYIKYRITAFLRHH